MLKSESVKDPTKYLKRILSKVQKSFWSCTHVNCCQKYVLYIHGNIKYPRIKKIHQVLEKITRIDQNEKNSIVSCYHMNCCLQKFTTHQFAYFIYYIFQDNFKNAKNDVNPTSTSGDIHKTIFIILFKLLSIGDSFKFKATK